MERVSSGKAPAGTPSSTSVRAELDAIHANHAIDIADENVAKRYLQAMRLVTPDNISLERAIAVLGELRSRFGNNRELLNDFRYAIAAVDLHCFRYKLA